MENEEIFNQRDIENKWQGFWKENKTFEPKVVSNQEKFMITVAYPYANSVLHIGHGRTFTMADIVGRYNRVLGKNVLYPMGFHISGTPVLAVADGIAKGDEKQCKITWEAISEYIENDDEKRALMESFKDPYKIAEFFSGKIEETFDSVGMGIDWTRQFSTGDDTYKKFIEWQYKKLHDLGILVQGKYPILYSAQDKNAVGEDDIKDGDLDKVTVSEMTYILFKLSDCEEYFAAGTLRADAIFGTTNLWIKPEMNLVKLKVDGKVWIVSKASQVKIEHQFDNVEFVEDCVGSDFLDKTVITPILNKEIPIYKMDYPDENHGTGIVYSSPADSPHDYIYLFRHKFPDRNLGEFRDTEPLNLTPITQTFDKKGNVVEYMFNMPAFDRLMKNNIFEIEGNDEKLEEIKQELYKEAHFGAKLINCGKYDGMALKNGYAAGKVKEKLEKLGLGGTFYETSRRAETRGGDKVIVANLDGQWFLNYKEGEIKQKAYDLVDNLEYKPQKLAETQKGYLKWVEMRPCARRRGIGTPLPYDESWVIEPLSDSTIYQMLYLIHHIIERENIKPEQLSLEVLDYVYLGQGNSVVIGEEVGVEKSVLEEMRSEVEYWQNVDVRYTNAGHMSNHLSFLIYHYALIFPQKNWPSNITVGGYLIKDGAKISKSKGNGIPLMRMKETYGVDMYRLYVAIAANYDVEMDFKDDEVYQLDKKFRKFKDLMSNAIKSQDLGNDELGDIDKWLISSFYSNVKKYFENFDEMKIRESYVAIFYDFLNSVNYHTRRTSEERTFRVLKRIVEDYLILMTPVIPHTCEEFNSMLGNESSISLMSFDKSKIGNFIDKDVEEIENKIQDLIANIYRNKEVKGINEIKSLKVVVAKDNKFALFDELGKLLSKTKNFKDIMQGLMKDFGEDKKFIQKFVPKCLGEGLSFYLSKEDEFALYEGIRSFLEEEFGVKIEFVNGDEFDGNSNLAIPGKPLVVLE